MRSARRDRAQRPDVELIGAQTRFDNDETRPVRADARVRGQPIGVDAGDTVDAHARTVDRPRPGLRPASAPGNQHRRHLRKGVLVVAFALPGFVRAQSPPDAGSLLEQIEQQRKPPLPARGAPESPAPPVLGSQGGNTITVKSFRFVGNTLLDAPTLTAAVAGFVDKPIDFATLQNAAVAVATVYRRAGRVVRAFLPQQDIVDGVVTIRIVEAVFGGVYVDGVTKRASTERLTGIVNAAQPPGTALGGDALDRALLLIDDVPGVSASGRLVEGRNEGETDLALTVVDGPLTSGDVIADNGGARSTGAARFTVDAALNSPLGLGDRADVLLLHTQGSDYGRVGYSIPLGSRGWRVGVNASYLSYKVITAEFAVLDAHGTSSTAGVTATYPLLRSQVKNLYFSATFDGKRFDNQSAGETTTRYKVPVASLGLYGNAFDDFGGGGANTANIAVEIGRVDLNGSPNQVADAATTQTGGMFRKLRFGVSRQQALTGTVSLFAGVSGQLANKNLDSSERFYLGGPAGVRAYPVSEGGGSQAALASVETRVRLPAGLVATGFFDWGHVQANRDNDIAGAALPNRYVLRGAGVALGWVGPLGVGASVTWARRIGSNPDATAAGDDQDGSRTKNRIWLQVGVPF